MIFCTIYFNGLKETFYYWKVNLLSVRIFISAFRTAVTEGLLLLFYLYLALYYRLCATTAKWFFTIKSTAFIRVDFLYSLFVLSLDMQIGSAWRYLLWRLETECYPLDPCGRRRECVLTVLWLPQNVLTCFAFVCTHTKNVNKQTGNLTTHKVHTVREWVMLDHKYLTSPSGN